MRREQCTQWKMAMIGSKIHDFAKVLWPINRSITGQGVRETLGLIQGELAGLSINSLPTGFRAFDWTVPCEWKVNEAYIITPSGEKICDVKTNNLHLMGYSIPVRKTLSLGELQNHLYSIEEQSDAIPYITSYYEPRWGFCLTHEQRMGLQPGDYRVVVDTELFDGELNYGELIIPGDTESEIFLSTYICHPSMANNEISGPAVLTFIAKWLLELQNRRYSYRLVFVPETIGSICYIAKNLPELKKNVKAGFNVTCIGDNRGYSFVPSRSGDTISDEVAKHTLEWIEPNYVRYSWLDRGSDERQYCAPGVDLPIASIMRSKYGTYQEYHTSKDDLESVVTPHGLDGGYLALKRALNCLEQDYIYISKVLCEPQLGKRGLYPTLSKKGEVPKTREMMNFISYCDGAHSLLDIAKKINTPMWDLHETAQLLLNQGLLERIEP